MVAAQIFNLPAVCNLLAHTNTDVNTNANTYTDTNTGETTDANTDAYTHAITDANTDTDGNTGTMSANAIANAIEPAALHISSLILSKFAQTVQHWECLAQIRTCARPTSTTSSGGGGGGGGGYFKGLGREQLPTLRASFFTLKAAALVRAQLFTTFTLNLSKCIICLGWESQNRDWCLAIDYLLQSGSCRAAIVSIYWCSSSPNIGQTVFWIEFCLHTFAGVT